MKRTWLALILLLGGFLAWRWLVPVQAPPIPPHPPMQADAGGMDELLQSMGEVSEAAPFAVYQSVAARPLFFHERRPPKTYVPDAPKSKPKPRRKVGVPRVQLSAVVTIGEQTFALIRGGRMKGTRRVRQGDDVDGWKVSKLTSNKMVLSNGAETHDVLLRQYVPVLPRRTPPRKAKPQAKKAVPAKPATKTVASEPVKKG